MYAPSTMIKVHFTPKARFRGVILTYPAITFFTLLNIQI